jgi:hypothetical protein
VSNDASNVGEALETLVHQFADPWSFLRELVQNAIDAGSEDIEVRIAYEPDEDASDQGLMIVEIVDSGEGMDRQIIDTRLTRLFSSAKEGDYTKIGRFGIGFVSVFAIAPELVCVDTGRNGEFWRVLFKQDRSFERIVLEQPLEGTTVRLYKRCSETELEQARGRARETLEYWCKHARVDIRIDDELISRPMDLAGHCLISHQEEDTKLLLAYVEPRAALRGYYHGGLTLHEEHDDRLPHVAYKIDSRYLEHTLTRDNVIRDDNFFKAMQIVGRLARTRLLEQLLVACEQAASERRFDAQSEFLRARLLEAITAESKPELDVYARPIVPTVAGEPVSLAEVRRQIKRCWQAPAPSPVTEHLRASGELVLQMPAASQLEALIKAHAERAPIDVGTVCLPSPATAREREAWERLRRAVLAVLGGLGHKLGDIALGHLAYPGSAVADHVAITQASFGELTPITEIGELSSGWFRSNRIVVLNADHPTVGHLLELAATEPELAAYLVLKLFFLSSRPGYRAELRNKLDPKLDGKLASLAAEARWQRSTG